MHLLPCVYMAIHVHCINRGNTARFEAAFVYCAYTYFGIITYYYYIT